MLLTAPGAPFPALHRADRRSAPCLLLLRSSNRGVVTALGVEEQRGPGTALGLAIGTVLTPSARLVVSDWGSARRPERAQHRDSSALEESRSWRGSRGSVPRRQPPPGRVLRGAQWRCSSPAEDIAAAPVDPKQHPAVQADGSCVSRPRSCCPRDCKHAGARGRWRGAKRATRAKDPALCRKPAAPTNGRGQRARSVSLSSSRHNIPRRRFALIHGCVGFRCDAWN